MLLRVFLFTPPPIVPVTLKVKVKVAQIGALPNKFAHRTTALSVISLYCFSTLFS